MAGPSTARASWQIRKRIRRGARTLVMKATTTFYRRLVVAYVPLERSLPTLTSQIPGTIRPLTEADLARYRELRPGQPLAEVRARLASGQECFATWVDGRIVDVSWLATGRVHLHYLERDLILAPDEAYIYDAYTAPELRARGLYQAKSVHLLRHCQEAGLRRVVAAYAAENTAPLTMARRFGVTFVGMFVCLRLGPWRRVWARPWGATPLPRLG